MECRGEDRLSVTLLLFYAPSWTPLFPMTLLPLNAPSFPVFGAVNNGFSSCSLVILFAAGAHNVYFVRSGSESAQSRNLLVIAFLISLSYGDNGRGPLAFFVFY